MFIFHEGACSDTMEYNGKYMMQNNFEYTKNLMHFAVDRKIQMIYASSASTYGSGTNGFREESACEEALNVYAFSKLFFDNYARRYFGRTNSQLVGLRYFNVYGPRKIIMVKWHPWFSRCIINGWQRKRLNYSMLTEIMVPVNRQEILFM